MGATIRVQDSIAAVQPYLQWANLTIGDNFEPALTAANMTLQTIVGPPFVWPWNRQVTSFIAQTGLQDYNASIANYGWLESATIQSAAIITSVTVVGNVAVYQAVNNFSNQDGFQAGVTTAKITGCTTSALNGVQVLQAADATSFTCNITTGDIIESEAGAKALSGKILPLEITWGSQGEATEQDRPAFISTQSSDESGTTYVFRLLPVPEQFYQVILTYQESPTAFTNPSNTWGIPDQLQYIYNYFFMFFMFDYFEDSRAARYRQLAIAALLARQSGLKASDRNLFLGNWLPLMAEEQSGSTDTQQGNQARGL